MAVTKSGNDLAQQMNFADADAVKPDGPRSAGKSARNNAEHLVTQSAPISASGRGLKMSQGDSKSRQRRVEGVE